MVTCLFCRLALELLSHIKFIALTCRLVDIVDIAGPGIGKDCISKAFQFFYLHLQNSICFQSVQLHTVQFANIHKWGNVSSFIHQNSNERPSQHLLKSIVNFLSFKANVMTKNLSSWERTLPANFMKLSQQGKTGSISFNGRPVGRLKTRRLIWVT